MQRFTTPMYRSPEILDTYQNFPIGPSQDVWALGCILIYLCYGRHPFEDSAKLAIVNANYRLPKEETPFTIFHPIIGKEVLESGANLAKKSYDRTKLGFCHILEKCYERKKVSNFRKSTSTRSIFPPHDNRYN
jgi:serine/threonine protein kinase